MNKERIRVITICVIRKGDSVLVFEGYDHVKKQIFYRPLGGGIKFGERSLDAIQRELREEIGARLVNLQYRATLENIFTVYGKPGHELIVIYEGEFADSSLYDKELILGEEDNGDPIKAMWMPLADFRAGKYPLYPTGLLKLLEEENE